MTMIPDIVRAENYCIKISKLNSKINDSKINDSKINDSKINDSKINDSKINDSKINDDDDSNDMFLFEYEEGYNKNNDIHIEAFQNIEQIKTFHEQVLSTYGKVSMDSNTENMTISLKMIAPFEKLANFLSMEFLMCGSLGKVTLLDFVSMAANSIVSNVVCVSDEHKENCNNTEHENNMYA